MNIIILSDFSDKNINKDFELANVLSEEHSILIVTSKAQLNHSIDFYDTIVKGFSCTMDLSKLDKHIINICATRDVYDAIQLIKKNLT